MKAREREVRETVAAISEASLRADLHRLGIEPGDSILVMSAISEIGWVEGGAKAVLDALLAAVGPQGSVFGLSFTRLYELPLSRSDAKNVFTRDSPAWTGSLSNLMLKHPQSVRSLHPSISFVGIGPRASDILPKHDVSSLGYYPAYELAQHDNSKMLLLGTMEKCPGLATVHVAQNLLGLKNDAIGRYGVYYVDRDGEARLYVCNYVGGCSRGFHRFYDHYRRAGAVSEGRVGNARCMLAKLRTTLSVDLEILERDPKFFFCQRPLCYSCMVSWDHSPFSVMRSSARCVQRLVSAVRRTTRHDMET